MLVKFECFLESSLRVVTVLCALALRDCSGVLVLSSNVWQKFPVKRTEPLTGILYITADKQHMEELKHAIHVKEIVEGELSMQYYNNNNHSSKNVDDDNDPSHRNCEE